MAHKTRIGGTSYQITGGKTRIAGVNYAITGGKTRIAGVNYAISFSLTIDNLFQHIDSIVFGLYGTGTYGRQITLSTAGTYYVFVYGGTSTGTSGCWGKITKISYDGSTASTGTTWGISSGSYGNLTITNNVITVQKSRGQDLTVFALKFSAAASAVDALLNSITQTGIYSRWNTSGGSMSNNMANFGSYVFIGCNDTSHTSYFGASYATTDGVITPLWGVAWNKSNTEVAFSNTSLLRVQSSNYYVSSNGSTNLSCLAGGIIKVQV